MCARHIWANWQKKWRGEERRKSFWKCAKASFEVKLKDEFTYLGMLGDRICESLLVYNKEFWCRALFSDKSKCDAVENNMCETFNSWIVGPRHKSVISMLEDIRHKIMDRHGDMIKFASTWTSDISPIASQVAGNKRKQPTASRNSTATKNSATMGFGVYTDTQSGRQVINPGRASERVISSGSLKDASQTNVDLGFEPPCLKWKGKNAMTANQLQVMSQRKQLQIKSNYVP